jgi:hypothetical protein
MAALGTIKRVAATGKAAKGANFKSKRERKRVRKSMVRGYVSNVITEARVAARERADFYRKLRQVKLRRRHIARELAMLAEMVSGLRREVVRVGDRSRHVDTRLLAEAVQLVKVADSSVGAAADEFWTFSRARVWYTEAVRS